MGKEVSLFSGYGQKENRTTNYCLLMLKLIYEENPKYLSEVVSGIVGEEIGSKVGVDFLQQTRKGKSVPDGIIMQRSFMVYIETKLGSGFSKKQLMNHLEALHEENMEQKVLLALGNFESDQEREFESIQQDIKSIYQDRLIFRAISFQEFIEALNIEGLIKNTKDAISDFQLYLDEQNLLPKWQTRLDVINCVGIPEDVLEGNVYMCPAESGAYSHKRSKYFGMYRNKKVEKIALIEAVVDVVDQGSAELKWKNTQGSNKEFLDKAIEKVSTLRKEYPIRVFLLGELFHTSFIKDTSGGLQGSKVYFDIADLKASDEEELAELLNGMVWSQLKK